MRVLRRGAWIILFTTVVVTAIAVTLSLSQEKLYQAHADVFLAGTRNLPSTLVDQQYFFDPERASNTQADLARVPEVAERAIRAAGLRGRTPDDLLGRSTITSAAKSDILRFSVTDPSPAVASRLATAYANAYTVYRRQLDTGSLVRARRQIERRLTTLEARRDTGTELYQRLADQSQQLRTSEALQESNVAVVRQGSEAGQVQPRPFRSGVLGAIFGLMLGVGLVFVREALTTRIRSTEEIQQRLELPLIGRIPEPKRRRADQGLVMLVDPHALGTEVYRILATNLGFVNIDRGAKSIMFTSASDGEGKSTTVANVAVALARSGSRVSLVDLDLKRPSLDRLFALDAPQPGFTGAALGMISLQDALIRVPLDDVQPPGAIASFSGSSGTLDFLPSGPIPPDSAQFIASARVSEILATLAEGSDIVLVDAPPMPHVSDAMALAGKVDAVVVVTRFSLARRPALDELRRVLDNTPVAKLGFVLTGVPPTEGYGYAYGGYSTNGTESKSLRRERVT